MENKIERRVIEFYKEAFCVDGEVKILPITKGFTITGVVELNDSKKGKFFVSRVEQQPRKERGRNVQNNKW